MEVVNREIKEIYLSNLEWTKIYDNMGGVMGNTVFKDSISYEEYQKLFKSNYFVLCNKDYITNLQQCYCNRTDCSGRIKDSKKYDSLQQRIDKAIEYINENYPTSTINYQEDKYKLLNILKGSDKE